MDVLTPERGPPGSQGWSEDRLPAPSAPLPPVTPKETTALLPPMKRSSTGSKGRRTTPGVSPMPRGVPASVGGSGGCDGGGSAGVGGTAFDIEGGEGSPEKPAAPAAPFLDPAVPRHAQWRGRSAFAFGGKVMVGVHWRCGAFLIEGSE